MKWTVGTLFVTGGYGYTMAQSDAVCQPLSDNTELARAS
jgi:hypothetical protein